MQQVVLYEFTVSGGLWRAGMDFDEGGSLLREGRAMLTALASDFAAMSGVEPIVLRDCRWSDLKFEGCKVLDVESAVCEESLLRTLSVQTAGAVLIAPETDGFLDERCNLVEEAGGWLIGPSAAIVNLTTDKQRTAEHLKNHGIRVPRGILLYRGDLLPSEFQYPAVLKPIDGCGSQDVRLIAKSSNERVSSLRFTYPLRLEEFVPGIPASVAVLCGPNELRPLAPCRQRLSEDGRFQYLGGSLPLPTHLARRAQALAVHAVATLPQARGYIGVDLVLGDDPAVTGDVVIEINPRLTTSYIGLRAAAQSNLAEAMWAIAEGRRVEVSFGDERIEFDSDGTVRTS